MDVDSERKRVQGDSSTTLEGEEGRCYYSHFTKEAIETFMCLMICSRFHT